MRRKPRIEIPRKALSRHLDHIISRAQVTHPREHLKRYRRLVADASFLVANDRLIC